MEIVRAATGVCATMAQAKAATVSAKAASAVWAAQATALARKVAVAKLRVWAAGLAARGRAGATLGVAVRECAKAGRRVATKVVALDAAALGVVTALVEAVVGRVEAVSAVAGVAEASGANDRCFGGGSAGAATSCMECYTTADYG